MSRIRNNIATIARIPATGSIITLMVVEVISQENAEHYVWGDSCDGWHRVRNSNLSVMEECMPAGTCEVSLCHRKFWQFFFILSGNAVMETDGRHISLSAGQGLRVPPGTC